MLVLGGAAVINSLIGVNIYLASFLIPHRRNRLLWRFEGNLLRRISHAAFIFGVVIVLVKKKYFNNTDFGGVEGKYEKIKND